MASTKQQRERDRILLKLDSVIYPDIDRHEGTRLRPYRDSRGILTIGKGRNLEHVGISYEEADILRENDVFRTIVAMDMYLQLNWRLQPYPVMRAVFNMCYQMGVGTVNNFRNMLYALEHRDYERAADEALDSAWARQTPERAKEVAGWIRSAANV